MQEKSSKDKLNDFLALDGCKAVKYGMMKIKMGLWNEKTMQKAMKMWIAHHNKLNEEFKKL